ncbi:basic helix-loop-helix protein A-like isoform X2 [Abrus precatorius]|uniref:Basic helix-loop-helix protein A-like isoform X2 n=1 Tax=Abrus precatorius TaxID=3816 RepID=A0A8B8ME70_ABRPR|nr:basic helix-loop-helix protein A-like isoform X2 [Abrus precatorius]
MAAPLGSRLQSMLQAAVQSVQWTYSLFWQLCPQQVILVWGDGYYNGAIKTRKTVQPMEVSAEEASLQRSQQLRELYESLSAGDTNPPTRRPCAALSPEDLTESEWFYLMCVSFSFPPDVGLPGKAYARRQHVWLTGANEVDSKTFSRAILAKTVVCIPLLDGVVEFGTTEKVQEDLNFIQHVKSFFLDHHHPLPPKPALSEHSTSNPTSSSDHIPTVMYTVADPPPTHTINQNDMDEDEEEEEDEAESASEDETGGHIAGPATTPDTAAEPSELMQLEMPEDIRVGSPNDGSNNLDSDFHLLAVSQTGNPSGQAESTRRWAPIQDPLQVQLPVSAPHPLEDLTQEDTHYSQTVSNILQNQFSRWTHSSPSVGYIPYSNLSAFAKWTTLADHHFHAPVDGTNQWLLKYILFTVPYLHAKTPDDNSPQNRDTAAADTARLRGKGTPQDELSANHVLAERRRREKLNERFIILRSLVPFVTKMDKASILGDTIEYVKQLRRKIQELEARNRQMEADATVQRTSSSSSKEQQRSGITVMEKRKVRIVEGNGVKAKAVEVEASTSVQVSIIESDALLELECPHREGLLLDVMQMLREVRIEVIGVQSSLNNGVFVAELRAKVKENANGKKVSIVEVKRALNQIIPHSVD